MFDPVAAEIASTFHLVQRMHVANRPTRIGLDSLFRLSYMGSSEYEWGTIPQALADLRAAGPVVVRTVSVEGRDVHLVGPEARLDAHTDAWCTWVATGSRSLDCAWFTEALAGEVDLVPDAWWALSAGFTWTLDADVAQRLAHGLTPRASAS